jgi:hypothetical protein
MSEYIYVVFIAIAFLSSLPLYRLDILHPKLIALVMGLDLVIEIIGNIQRAHHQPNALVYDLALLEEFFLYGLYFKLIIPIRWYQVVIRCYLVILPVVWAITSFGVMGVHDWNSHLYDFGSLFIVLSSAVYYYQLFTAEKLVELHNSFEFWVATALLFYFASTQPYLGMLGYLNKTFRPLAHAGISILQIINIIFYSLITYACLCLWRTNTRKS